MRCCGTGGRAETQFHVFGALASLAFIALWLSTHRTKEEMLRESEVRFRAMADSAPALIWMCDAGSQCSYASRAWLEFTGRAIERELGNGWLDGVHADDREQVVTGFKEAMELGTSSQGIELRLFSKNGDYRWMLAKS